MAAKDSYRTRRFFIFIHRYIGLTIGLAIVVLGVTGSIAVYWREIDRVVRPELDVTPQATAPISLGEVLAVVKRAHPQRPKPWTLEMPYDEHSAYQATYSRPEEKGLKYSTNLHVAVDPYTGEILSEWYWGETALSWIYDLHAMFQAGLTGHKVVGAFGVVLLFVSATGLYVWWPMGRFAKRHFLVKTGAGAPRLELDLHRAGGFYSLPLMIVFAVTGYMFVFPSHLGSVVARVSTLSVPTPTSLHGGDETHGTSKHAHHQTEDTRYPKSKPREGVAAMSVDQAIARAQAVFPDATLRRVYTPAGVEGVYGIIMRRPIERLSKTYPNTEVWLDQYDGRVIVASDPALNSAGQDFLDSALPLHNGEAAGGLGRALVFVAGLVPLLLFVTGLLQWLRRRRMRSSTESSLTGVTQGESSA
jgi:uncharacterized iron-regulated membrane protein